MTPRQKEIIESILMFYDSSHYTKKNFRATVRVTAYLMFKAEIKRSPKTEEEMEIAQKMLREVIERDAALLGALSPSVLGDGVDWEKVRFGYLTKTQAENLRAYYEREKDDLAEEDCE